MPWDDVIPLEELEIVTAAGYGGQLLPGEKTALLVVDVTYGFTGKTPMPLPEAIKEYSKSCGEAAWDAISTIRRLIERARENRVPIVYTRNEPAGRSERRGLWSAKVSSARTPSDSDEIVREIRPRSGDLVITKSKPSAFFATPLTSWLIDRAVDTLYITGGTTSGCVRATVTDGFSYNYRMFIVEEGVFDRSKTAHKVNLFDLHHKYAQVTDVESALIGLTRSEGEAAGKGALEATSESQALRAEGRLKEA
jgi:maleamate amidohydrolase